MVTVVSVEMSLYMLN